MGAFVGFLQRQAYDHPKEPRFFEWIDQRKLLVSSYIGRPLVHW